jgi:hypothetical protein
MANLASPIVTTGETTMIEDKVFLACCSQGVTRAERGPDGEWTVTTHLEDVEVTCLADDPRRPGLVLAGAADGGIWRSRNRGTSWEKAGSAGAIVKSMAVSSVDPRLVFAGGKPASVYRSDDGGTTWREMLGFRRTPNRWWWFSPAEPPDFRPYVLSIAPSPIDPDVLLAGVEFGAVVRSEDGGETWSRHRTGALRDSHSLKFHQADGNWLYQAGGTGGGASFSNDGGVTFQKAGRELDAHYGIVCAADPERPEFWYVCVGLSPGDAFGDEPHAHLYRAEAGAGWHPIGWDPHPLRETPTALVTLPQGPGALLAGVKGGDVYYTADYGDSWRKLPFNLGGIWYSLVVC